MSRLLGDRLLSGRLLADPIWFPVAPDLHFVADDLTAGAVASWPSRTGGSVDQATSNNQPTCVANELNGHSVVRFDGTNDRLTGSISTPQPLSIVAVVKSNDPTTTQRMFYGSGTGGGQLQLGQDAGSWRAHGGQSAVLYGSAVDGNWHVVCAAIDSANSMVVVDGAPFSGPLGTADGGATLVIGALGNQSNFWSGDLAELVVWQRRLELFEFRNATYLFRRKYGIGP